MPRRKRAKAKAGTGAGPVSPIKTVRHLKGQATSTARTPGRAFDPRSPVGKKHYRAAFSTGRLHKCAAATKDDIEAVAGKVPVGAPPSPLTLKQAWLLIMSRIETCLIGDIALHRVLDPDIGPETAEVLAGRLTRSVANSTERDHVTTDAYSIVSNYKFWMETWSPLVNKLQELARTMKRIGMDTKGAEAYILGLDTEVAAPMLRDIAYYNTLVTFYGSPAALIAATRGKTLFK